MTQNKIENTHKIIWNIMFTTQVLSQEVNKLRITSIYLCYIITKNTASMKNPV